MDRRTLRVLEYDKIISMLEKYALSEMGKSLVNRLEPSWEISSVEAMLEETLEAYSIITHIGASPMDAFKDIRDILDRARIGSVLSARQLLKVAVVLKVTGHVKKEIDKYPHEENIPIILNLTKDLQQHKELMKRIFRCIESEDRVSDYASKQLASIRRKIQNTNDGIRERLNNMIHSHQFQKFLQESIVTVRNNRYVIPVKQEHRGNVPGMIHDQSASGATLYIEPMPIVEANNHLKELFLEEEKEIEKILLELTIGIQSVYESIENNLEILAKLDLVFAKATFSRSYRGVCPEILHKPAIDIVKGRHPLIDEDEVVPISVGLGEDSKCLIITGPNTGGKTVTLKTVGLFVLMIQSGLFIPADYGSKLGVFKEVFADIGDEQSIEQSLSTFSSHMVHIADIVKKANNKSLVLLDELGAGTDPTEGAALAMAILDYFRAKDVFTIATTHYSELKIFALTQVGMKNASMEFDIETLRPTYRLLMGIPGKSNAFEISSRLGLKIELIERAKGFLSQEDIHFEDVLTDMEMSRLKTEKRQEEIENKLAEINTVRNRLKDKEDNLKRNEDKILNRARHEARNILRQAKEQADQIINQMRKMVLESQEREHRRAMEEARHELKGSLEEAEAALGNALKPTKGLTEPPKDLKLGQSVHILNLNQKGQVLSISNEGDEVQVQVGIMKVNAHISNLRVLEEDTQPKGESPKLSSNIRNKSISMELDLRGQNLDQALINVDKYLDDVFLAGLEEVVLIHGKGTGVLREGIHRHLKHHPHVSTFRLGRFGEGEAGVTIVGVK